MEWRRITARDDWGHLEYEPALTPSQDVAVRWPDGTISTERVKGKARPVTIHDMGNSYEVEQVQLGIEVSVRGVIAWVDMRALEVLA